MENYSLADVAAATGKNDGVFGGSGGGMWIFALLILVLLGGGGGFFGGRGDRAATVGDVQRSTDFAALERQNNEIVAAVRQGVYDTTGAIKDGNYNILGEIRDIQNETNSGFAAMQKCCCDTLRAIDSVNYNGAINTAAINANTTASMQKILDAITGNRFADMQNRINQLELQSALCGIPRISNYAYGVVPNFVPIQQGCGCNGNNNFNI